MGGVCGSLTKTGPAILTFIIANLERKRINNEKFDEAIKISAQLENKPLITVSKNRPLYVSCWIASLRIMQV